METINDVNKRMLETAAEFAGEGLNAESLDILDTVRAQMVETLQEQKEARDTVPCSPPFQSVMRPDYQDPKLDNPTDFTHG